MFKIICNKCNNKAEIMSCRRISNNEVSLTFICPYCGQNNEEIHYLYENNEKKT